MTRRTKKRTRTRALILESLDPRLCLAAGIGAASMAEMHVDNASAHVSHWHNTARPHDVNRDQNVTAADALVVLNTLNARGARTLSAAEGETTAQVDVNGDSQVTAADCVAVVNELNRESVVGATVDDGTVDDGTVDHGTVDDGEVDDLPPGRHGHCDTPRPSLEDLFAGANANEDGVLTEDELPEHVWERLSAADADGDGSLTLEELTAFTPDGGPHGPRHDGRGDGDVLERFDENDDGLLTADEVSEQLWEHLSPADADGDGTISSEELADYRPESPSREDLFARLDTDGDGALTEDELPAELWGRLSAADTNGDGGITLDELIAFKPEDRPHGPRPGGNCDGVLFDRLDQNDDGLLAQDEVPEKLWERILAADTDEDGLISSAELAAFRPSPPSREGIPFPVAAQMRRPG